MYVLADERADRRMDDVVMSNSDDQWTDGLTSGQMEEGRDEGSEGRVLHGRASGRQHADGHRMRMRDIRYVTEEREEVYAGGWVRR